MSDVPGFASGGREPRFDLSAEIGYQGELFADNLRQGLAEGWVEVKTDERAAVTGRCFFEYQCRLRDGWQPSGIASTEAALWLQIVARRIGIVIPVDLLRPVCSAARDEGRTLAGGTDGGNPTRGVILPLPLLFARLFAEARRRSGM
jgi:hypothetical protein